MPVTLAVNSILDRLTQATLAALDAQGEKPASLPRCGTAQQAALLAGDLPATVLLAGKLSIGEEDRNTGALRLCQPVTLYHARRLSPGGSAVETATGRLAGVGAALYRDYRLAGVSQAGDQVVEMVRIIGMAGGDENPVQQILDMSDENGAVICVGLELEIDWVEDDLPPPVAP